MTNDANGARGEVPLSVGGVDIVIAAEMAGLAKVSTRLECKSLADLFQRLSGAEPAATLAAVELLAVRGDGKAAAAKVTLKDMGRVADAIAKALAHSLGDDEGNGAPAGQAG